MLRDLVLTLYHVTPLTINTYFAAKPRPAAALEIAGSGGFTVTSKPVLLILCLCAGRSYEPQIR